MVGREGLQQARLSICFYISLLKRCGEFPAFEIIKTFCAAPAPNSSGWQ